MRRAELKKILENNPEKSKAYYVQYPTLHRDLMLWEDYLQRIEQNREAGFRAAKNNARYEILDAWRIGENTFYLIKRTLSDLCEDVE